jgi:pyruvate formate lyase activating enzyme
VCRVRFNRGGELRAPSGYFAGLQVDPIEKKPFYHAFPGRDALSFGMLGCDFHCGYCQNWISSQTLRDDNAVALPTMTKPSEVVQLAVDREAPVMVSTYNEPLITADWAVTVFREAREKGITCGFVSNGNGTPEVLSYIRPYVDLYKVDLKSFQDRNYRRLGGTLQNVLDTIAQLKEMDFWVEIVTLVVPDFNDSDEELRDMAKFLAGVSTEIPWHLTAFHPDYKMKDKNRTNVDTLLKAYDFGKEAGLKYVYCGNAPGKVGNRENTYCHACGELLIERYSFLVKRNHMQGNHCPSCEADIPGVWEHTAPKQSTGNGRPQRVW